MKDIMQGNCQLIFEGIQHRFHLRYLNFEIHSPLLFFFFIFHFI